MVARMVKNLPAVQETEVQSPAGRLGWEDPLQKGMALFLPGESHGQTMVLQRVRHDGATKTFTFSFHV